MPIRFQADADLNQIIVSAIARREPAIDFRTAPAAGLAGLDDPQVLARAAHDGRVLVTHDQTPMPGHFGEFVRVQRSPGLVVVPQHFSISRSRGRPDPDSDGHGSGRVDRSNDLPPNLTDGLVHRRSESLV